MMSGSLAIQSVFILLLLTFVECATRYSTELSSRAEECFMEEMHARSTANRMLFRFNLVQPESYDALDVRIVSPSKRDIKSWTGVKNGQYVEGVRDNGLYKFCFRKRQGSHNRVRVYFHLDFINAGSKTLTSYPITIASVSKSRPSETDMYLQIGGGLERVGFFDFDLHDVSPSIIHDNTRVMIQLSVEFASVPDQEVILTEVSPKDFKHPLTYSSMESVILDSQRGAIDYSDASSGQGMYFDVTDVVEHALDTKQQSICFQIHSKADGAIKISGTSQAAIGHWPTLVFEGILKNCVYNVTPFFRYGS